MKGVLMDALYLILCVLLVVLLIILAPVRIVSKMTQGRYKLSSDGVSAESSSVSVQYIRRIETILAIVLSGLTISLLAAGYFLPLVDGYSFEFRIPMGGLSAVFVLAYAVRTVRSFRIARRLESQYKQV